MKSVTWILITCFFVTAIAGCQCSGEQPRARIINNGTDKASVQIKTSGGNTVNINNIQPGTASAYSSYAAGQITFTITVSSIDYVEVVNTGTCYDYDIAIDANNVITTLPINRND